MYLEIATKVEMSL